ISELLESTGEQPVHSHIGVRNTPENEVVTLGVRPAQRSPRLIGQAVIVVTYIGQDDGISQFRAALSHAEKELIRDAERDRILQPGIAEGLVIAVRLEVAATRNGDQELHRRPHSRPKSRTISKPLREFRPLLPY